MQRLGRAVIDRLLELGDLVQQLVDLLASLSPGKGIQELRTCPLKTIKFEEKGLEAVLNKGLAVFGYPLVYIGFLGGPQTCDPVVSCRHNVG